MQVFAHIRREIYRVLSTGTGRKCNVCGQSCRRFLPYGRLRRGNACCANCKSLERHRLTWEFFRTQTPLFQEPSLRMLHVAPEECFCERFRVALGSNYVTADLFDPAADFAWDIMDVPQPDESFDVIYCSHVLEHVDDDLVAMREFFRLLKKTGWAVLNVPITADTTHGDPAITDPKERERMFGQHDHVRRYGPDYVDRLRQSGFTVRAISADDMMPATRQAELGVDSAHAGHVFYCTK